MIRHKILINLSSLYNHRFPILFLLTFSKKTVNIMARFALFGDSYICKLEKFCDYDLKVFFFLSVFLLCIIY